MKYLKFSLTNLSIWTLLVLFGQSIQKKKI